jgi:hypothetical protein
MSMGVSMFLVAVGAILTFALRASMKGINLGVVGVILMAVGILGFVVSTRFGGRPSGWKRPRNAER